MSATKFSEELAVAEHATRLLACKLLFVSRSSLFSELRPALLLRRGDPPASRRTQHALLANGWNNGRCSTTAKLTPQFGNLLFNGRSCGN
jgi:hypothetical protein